ncbi:hypothetical protein ACCO45_009944 [Purpureocillium lilacinum]|uniref:Uncharacterized protein n=1 Tax=Purpureocillium lilacinum TaxID=33203 RepID=A0ACC4DDP7_PURLI
MPFADGCAITRNPLGLLLLLTVLCLMYASWRVIAYPRFASPLRHLPQPPGCHWLTGHGQALFRDGPGICARKWYATAGHIQAALIPFRIQDMKHNGMIRAMWPFGKECVVLLSPAAISEVLVQKGELFEKSYHVRVFAERVIGNGLLLAEGPQHKMQRRHLTPAFGFRKLKELLPIIEKKAKESVEQMRDDCAATADGRISKDLFPWASRCSLDIIGLAGFSLDFGAIRNKNSPLVSLYRTALSQTQTDRLLMIMAMFFPGWLVRFLPFSRNTEIRLAKANIRQICQDTLLERISQHESDGKKSDDILSTAMQCGNFSDNDIVNQMMNFLAAGHETTASALTWAVHLLAMHRSLQDQLRQDIMSYSSSSSPSNNRPPIHVDEIPLLWAVCEESLRVCSPVAQTTRVALFDVHIQGQLIPKGTLLYLVPWATNVDSALWGPDANDFNPYRWLQPLGTDQKQWRRSDKKRWSNYAYMTFSHGRHNCIGQSFARKELAFLLFAWVRAFTFELVEPQASEADVDAMIVTRMRRGTHVRFSPVPE